MVMATTADGEAFFHPFPALWAGLRCSNLFVLSAYWQQGPGRSMGRVCVCVFVGYEIAPHTHALSRSLLLVGVVWGPKLKPLLSLCVCIVASCFLKFVCVELWAVQA